MAAMDVDECVEVQSGMGEQDEDGVGAGASGKATAAGEYKKSEYERIAAASGQADPCACAGLMSSRPGTERGRDGQVGAGATNGDGTAAGGDNTRPNVEPQDFPVATRTDVVLVKERIQLVEDVQEFWCFKSSVGYPKTAADAASAVCQVLDKEWLRTRRIRGPPMAGTYAVGNGFQDKAKAVATGLVEIVRDKFDGWQLDSLPRIEATAWRVWSGIDHCSSVKAFGKSSNFAREINWVYTALHKYLEVEEHVLSVRASEIAVGYLELRANQAMDSGDGWKAGPIYGVNVPLEELEAVVAWATAEHKKGGLKDLGDLELKWDGQRALSTSDDSCFFRSSRSLVGSVTAYVQSQLSLGEFEMDGSDGAPGVALIRCKFGEDNVCKVVPSCPRGMSDKGIVKVRILCELRFERWLRSVNSKLIHTSRAEQGGAQAIMIGDRTYEVKFLSLQAANDLVEAGEMTRKGGGRGALDNSLRELQAENAKAVAKLTEVMEQVENLADTQRIAQLNNEKNLAELAEAQKEAAATTQTRIQEAVQAARCQIQDLADSQAQALADTQELIATNAAATQKDISAACRDAINYSSAIHQRTQENLDKLTLLLSSFAAGQTGVAQIGAAAPRPCLQGTQPDERFAHPRIIMRGEGEEGDGTRGGLQGALQDVDMQMCAESLSVVCEPQSERRLSVSRNRGGGLPAGVRIGMVVASGARERMGKQRGCVKDDGARERVGYAQRMADNHMRDLTLEVAGTGQGAKGERMTVEGAGQIKRGWSIGTWGSKPSVSSGKVFLLCLLANGTQVGAAQLGSLTRGQANCWHGHGAVWGWGCSRSVLALSEQTHACLAQMEWAVEAGRSRVENAGLGNVRRASDNVNCSKMKRSDAERGLRVLSCAEGQVQGVEDAQLCMLIEGDLRLHMQGDAQRGWAGRREARCDGNTKRPSEVGKCVGEAAGACSNSSLERCHLLLVQRGSCQAQRFGLESTGPFVADRGRRREVDCFRRGATRFRGRGGSGTLVYMATQAWWLSAAGPGLHAQGIQAERPLAYPFASQSSPRESHCLFSSVGEGGWSRHELRQDTCWGRRLLEEGSRRLMAGSGNSRGELRCGPLPTANCGGASHRHQGTRQTPAADLGTARLCSAPRGTGDILEGVFSEAGQARDSSGASGSSARETTQAHTKRRRRVGRILAAVDSMVRQQCAGGWNRDARTRVHTDYQSLLSTCCGCSRQAWTPAGVAFGVSRLGLHHGCGGSSSSPDSERSSSGAGSEGLCHHGSGGSCRSSHPGAESSGRELRPASCGVYHNVETSEVRVAVLGHGPDRGSYVGDLWATMGIRSGLGSSLLSEGGLACSLGTTSASLHHRFSTQFDARNPAGSAGGGGCHVLQLEVRSMVGCTAATNSRSPAARYAPACVGRGSSHSGCGALRTPQGGGDGMRCEHYAQVLRSTVEDTPGNYPAAQEVEMVSADHMPAKGPGRRMAKEKVVGDRSPCAPRKIEGSALMIGTLLGMCGMKFAGICVRWKRWLGGLWAAVHFWIASRRLRLRKAGGGTLRMCSESVGLVAAWGCAGTSGKENDNVNQRDWQRGDDKEGSAGAGGQDHDLHQRQGSVEDTAGACSVAGQEFKPRTRPVCVFTGRVLFWNARQLLVRKDRGARAAALEDRMADHKLRFLEHHIKFHDPWLVAVIEVSGDRGCMVALRIWFKQRGYGMVFQVGDGCSRGQGYGRASYANGIVVAYRRGMQVVAAQRLAFRTLAVSVRHMESDEVLQVAVMHGASLEGAGGIQTRDETRAFCEQLDAAERWCRGCNGVLLADANRVPCVRWRCPGQSRENSLSPGDRALRKLTGWYCACCSGTPVQGDGQHGILIGAQVDDMGVPRWTRWGNDCKSRLDVGIAFGAAQEVWKDHAIIRPEWRTAEGRLMVSDHALLAYHVQLTSKSNVLIGEERPLPVRLGSRPGEGGDATTSAWQQMGEITRGSEFRMEMFRVIQQSVTAGLSQVEALTNLIRRTGEQAVRQANAARFRRQGGQRRCGRGEVKSELRSWEERLRVAENAGRKEGNMSKKDWLTLFHPKTRLLAICTDARISALCVENWESLISKCKKKVRRAGAALHKLEVLRDRALVEGCASIEAKLGEGAAAHTDISKIWRLVSDRKPNLKMQEIHRGDKKDASKIRFDDADFLFEAGRIGENFVRAMDRGTVAQAFTAWLRTFSRAGEEVEGAEGCWSLRSDFTYSIYEKVLKAMTGKAVGAGGLSVELLLAASEEVRRLFYEAILHDVEQGCIARHWKRILYVLLPKPRPNDPAIISQRREIALAPQDLKIMLQGLRWTAYARVCDRLTPDQYGWRAGTSCTDPSLALGCVLNQARRLGHRAWVLYIDLANFFPAINREIACMGELHMGLPEKVADIMGSIYGGQRSCTEFVECQYETAAGLSAPFRNHVGRLMGCPVSPDSAKILLDSVLRAIKQSVRGVRLWPFEGAELAQLAFADDWCGVFDDLCELKKALTIWVTWIQVVGAALGIKGLVKTVASGVEYKDGKALTPPNPRLKDAEGNDIPFLSCDQFYKHLGIPRSCDSVGSRAWQGGNGVLGVKDKLRAGLRRLRRVRSGSMSLDEFIMVSNVLLGCTAGFYLSSCVASADELEQIEVEWRKLFNRFAGRDSSEPVSELYAPALRWTKGRVHLRCVGSAAIFAAVERAMADVLSSPASMAVRSAVALSLYQHGCRSDPNRWSWTHLREVLERDLRGKGPRYLGDAWMLAALEAEDTRDSEGVWSDRVEAMRGAAWGRWKGLSSVPADSKVPLRPNTAWFSSKSVTLFDPIAVGGLGLAPCRHLLAAGVHELHDLCSWPLKGASAGGSWLRDKRVVADRFKVKISKGWWAAWESTLQKLQLARVNPMCAGYNVGRQWRRYPVKNRVGLVRSTSLRGLRSMRDRWSGLAQGLRRARLGKDDSTPAEVWQRRLEAAFPRAHEDAGLEVTNAGNAPPSSRRALIVWSLSRDEAEEVPQWGNFLPSVLPVARRTAWQDEGQCLRRRVRFGDRDGWPLDGTLGRELTESEVAGLPPGPQLLVRARMSLGKGATVRARGFGDKLKDVRVALDVQLRVWERVCDLQARFGFTHAFTGDSSWGEVHDEDGKVLRDDAGWAEKRVSAASISASGVIMGGLLPPHIPYSNYAGEIVALLLALKASPDGASVLLIFDASSPLRAWAKFGKVSLRSQCGYQEAELLAELEVQLQRMNTVFLLWLSSHCGAPVNEWPDIEADRLREQGEILQWLPVSAPQVFVMWPAKVMGPVYRWAVNACRRSLLARFHKKASWVLCREDTDWDLGLLPEAYGVLAGWTRCEKLMVGDAGHKEGRLVRIRHKGGCVAECTEGSSCWQHYLFACSHPLLTLARARVREWIYRHQLSFDCLGLHKQILALKYCLDPRWASTGRSLDEDKATAARRVFCGFLRRDACDIGSTVNIARNAVRELVVRCCEVARVAFSLEDPLRETVSQEIREQAHLRRAMKEWLSLHVRAGPVRVAAMRQTRFAAQMVRWAAVWGPRLGKTTEEEADRLRAAGGRLCKVARVEVRDQWPLLEMDAARLLWFLSMKLWGRMVRRDRGWFDPSQLRATAALAAAWRLLCKSVPGVDKLRGSKKDLWWRMGETSSTPPHSGGWVRISGAVTRFRAACRGFYRMGGYPKLRGTLRRLRHALAAAQLERMREWMRSWLQMGSCSGRGLKHIREEERITLNLPPRKRARIVLRERLVAAGAAADKMGRWAVREILRVRRQIGLPRKCKGVGGWEVLIDWCGQDTPSWEPYLHLNSTLRLLAKEMIAEWSVPVQERRRQGAAGGTRKRKAVEEPSPMDAAGRGRRCSPRVAEAERKRAKLQTALVVYAPPQEKAGGKGPRSFHAVAELTERLVIDNQPFVRVRWKHPAPGDPEMVHFTWLSVDLQDALLEAARLGRSSLVVEDPLM